MYRKKLICMFQNPVKEEEQIKTKKGEQKYSPMDKEALSKAFDMGCQLEYDINAWAEEVKEQAASRRQEKFKAIYYALEIAMPIFRDDLMNKNKTPYDLVRMGRKDFSSDQQKREIQDRQAYKLAENRTDF